MDLVQLIKHPETMDKETLYDLRSLIALYPYYQSARLLMLQNLYVLHDPTFDEELRKAAIYITDRKVIFNLVEAAHYKLQEPKKNPEQATTQHTGEDRTIALIDNFLESIPTEEADKESKKRKPTPADAAIDYVSYLLETENPDDAPETPDAPQMKGHELIDNFIRNDGGKIDLKEEPEYLPEINEESENSGENESYYTETLSRIYIQQGKFEKALEIIKRLNLNYPKKSAYFADQMRFLEKLIRNSNAAKGNK
jgi:hypothetical protein